VCVFVCVCACVYVFERHRHTDTDTDTDTDDLGGRRVCAWQIERGELLEVLEHLLAA
jgi:hypothetical protein